MTEPNRSVKLLKWSAKHLIHQFPKNLVWLALDQLSKEKLLEDKDLENTNYLGMSRREVVRKVGLSSMVALPLISSIVVPNSVQGQSCIPNDGLCAVPADCCSTCCADISDGGPTCISLAPNVSCPACVGAPGC